MVRHTTTQRWKHWKAVSGAGRVKDAPYVLACTATPAHTPLELPYLAPEFAVRHGEALREWADLPHEARRARVPRGTWPVRLAVDRGRRRAPRRPRPAAGLAGRRRSARDAAPAGAVGPGVGDRHPGGADPGRAGGLRVGVVGVPRGDAAGPALPAERQGPRGAAAVPAEGRPDPRAGHRRLDQGAGGGRASGGGVGGVRRDGGRPDPRGAARRRASRWPASTAATGSTSRPSGCASSAARRWSACSP